jgi:hypothetical protein
MLIRDCSGKVVDTKPYHLIDGYKVSSSSITNSPILYYLNPTISVKNEMKLLSAPSAKLLLATPR